MTLSGLERKGICSESDSLPDMFGEVVKSFHDPIV